MKKPLEKELEYVIKHYPNLIDPSLRPMPDGFLGQVNVCVQQGCLEEGGRLDLAFVTGDTVFLVEMKRNEVNLATLRQGLTYAEKLRKLYPKHRIRLFLVGERREESQDFSCALDAQCAKVLVFGRDIPDKNQITFCPNRDCRAGLSIYASACPYCGTEIL
jgi:hypothetical protein